MKFKDRQEQRKVTETMNAVIRPLMYYLDKETKKRFEIGMRILNNTEIENERRTEMKLINADKYKKDIEHYRNTICYQRNVTMDDCMRILDKQENVLDKIREEIRELKHFPADSEDKLFYNAGVLDALEIIDRYREGESK